MPVCHVPPRALVPGSHCLMPTAGPALPTPSSLSPKACLQLIMGPSLLFQHAMYAMYATYVKQGSTNWLSRLFEIRETPKSQRNFFLETTHKKRKNVHFGRRWVSVAFWNTETTSFYHRNMFLSFFKNQNRKILLLVANSKSKIVRTFRETFKYKKKQK